MKKFKYNPNLNKYDEKWKKRPDDFYLVLHDGILQRKNLLKKKIKENFVTAIKQA